MPGTSTIGIDVGGTFIRAGMVTRNGEVGAVVKCSTPRDATGESLVDALARVVDHIADTDDDRRHTTEAIGVGLPGIVDEPKGRLLRSLNLSGVEGCPLADALADRLRLPVRLMTDMQAATWAEYTACKPAPRRFAHLRLGTGVGLFLVTEGLLERVEETRTTHHPLLVVDRRTSARPCPCGLSGCLENIVSARALAGMEDPRLHADALARLRSDYEMGSAEACMAMERAANAIVQAICHVVNEHQVNYICLGGGVVEALPGLRQAVVNQCRRQETDPNLSNTCIAQAELGDKAGVIGAAQLARSSTPGPLR